MYLHRASKNLITFISAGCLALFSLSAQAGAPQGHLDSIEGQLKSKIYDEFENLGRGNESRFSEVAKAFLWDQRDFIRSEKVKKSRQADAIVCILMVRYNRSGFESYNENSQFSDWCQGLIRN
jgi:hypothetical protein